METTAVLANEFDPRIIQGLLTLLAGLVASVTALVIAIVIYPWQRNKDRKNEILAERRLVYSEYLERYARARLAVFDAQYDFSNSAVLEAHKELLIASNRLSVFASEAVLELSKDLQGRFLFQINGASIVKGSELSDAYPDPKETIASFEPQIAEASRRLIDQMRAEVADDQFGSLKTPEQR